MVRRVYRLGIDVGGTFTHGVILDSERRVIKKANVPTTHGAEFGVAEGIVETIEHLLEGIDPADVDLVAHSTTQATNSILEGDVALVLLVVTVPDKQLGIARALFHGGEIELGEGSAVKLIQRVIGASELPPEEDWCADLLEDLTGIEVITLVESRGTDDPTGEYEERIERSLISCGATRGRHVVKASELSGRLGLKLRAKTAVINAAMIPAVFLTARYTREAVEKTLPGKKLKVLKSDGGLMDLKEMGLKPLNSVLSGPAAGASAAVHVARVSDGVFIEVGGTSTDISLIRAGRVKKSAAVLGGHVLHTRSLDLRTVGVGGGSLLWVDGRGSIKCGARSAHIAGLSYLSFPPDGEPIESKYIHLDDSRLPFLTIRSGAHAFGITLTDAANFLGLIPEDDAAFSRHPLLELGFDAAARHLKKNPLDIARRMTQICRDRVAVVIKDLARDYGVKLADLRLVGGGGGVHSIIGEVASALGTSYEVTDYPEVISAIGVAAAVSTCSFEVFSVEPTEEDFRALKKLALRELEKAGVPADQARVNFEYVAEENLLRVEGEGTLSFAGSGDTLDDGELLSRAAELAGCSIEDSRIIFEAENTVAVSCSRHGGGLFRGKSSVLVCLERSGRSLLVAGGVNAIQVASDGITAAVKSAAKDHTRYTDAGETLPEIYILTGSKLLDLSSFVTEEQILGALEALRDEITGASLVIVRKKG